LPTGFQSRSAPNLPTVTSLGLDPEKAQPTVLSPTPSEPASIEDNDETTNADLFSTESDSSENDIDPAQVLHERLYGHTQASRSHTHLPPSTSQLFPPFYNRPPTPLPPSPSLTSLLRPSLSRHTSRPTTPDSSDAESVSQAGTSTAAAVEKSARTATTVPRASPKVPTYEYYGFALYLASSGVFLMYLLWAYLPSPLLHQLGIYYYPNRWWALAVPAWLVVTILYIYIALASYNTQHLTLPMANIENLVDEAAQIAVIDRVGRLVNRKKAARFGGKDGHGHHHRKGGGRGKHSHQNSGSGLMGPVAKSVFGAQGPLAHDFDWRRPWSEGTDAVMDVPIGAVNQILYGEGRRKAKNDD
jgi:phosphatidylinositol N-acetylglucosaminyltransferase subunit P